MVSFSKRRVLPALLLIMTVAQAQFFTDVAVDRKRANRND